MGRLLTAALLVATVCGLSILSIQNSGNDRPDSAPQLNSGEDQWEVEYLDIDNLRPVSLISRGQAVDVERHVSQTGYTVIEFTAPWCSACRALGPRLEVLARSRNDLAVRRVELSSWNCEVAMQYDVRAIPYLLLYEDGKLAAKGTAAVLRSLEN